MKAKSISYKINDEVWKFHIISDRSYISKFKAGSAAICLLQKKEVYFRRSDFNPATVAHELMHILFDQCNSGSAELNAHQVEELACEVLGRWWYKVPRAVMEVYEELAEITR